MSDNLRRYCAIQHALRQQRPTEPKGNVARIFLDVKPAKHSEEVLAALGDLSKKH